MNIILIGFMGCGKSTVAKLVAERLGRECVEMDALACQMTGVQTMGELFAKGGELLLRETEIAIAKEYASKTNLVVSTGGGVVLNKIVLDYFKRWNGKVIFLHASFDTLVNHVKGDHSRPLWKQDKMIYDFRLPLYIHYADEIVDVNERSLEEIASQLHGF